MFDWDWTAAEHAIRRSIELRPDNVNVHISYSQYFAVVGQLDESIREARRAIEIDPLSNASAWLAHALLFARRDDEAIVAAKSALELNPSFFPSYMPLCFAHQRKGELIEAMDYADKAVSIARIPICLSIQGWICAVAGRRDDAMRVLDQLKELAKNVYVAPLHFATVYAGLGNVEAWRKAMRDSYEERSNGLVFMKLMRHFEPLQSDPVFQEIAGKIGLP